ncbi:MAG: peptidoglycan glycosyltransferase [Clostridiaceae bacterium]|nr:peptidoglycan glycosyltransferase [Clostridiaceae bacterium]
MQKNKKIIHILVVMSILFLSIVAYLTYFELFMKEEVVANSYNQRLREQDENVIRGTIYDRNMIVLAESRLEGENQERIYPYKNLYSHIIGYSSLVYGKSFIEARYNQHLIGATGLSSVFNLGNQLTGTAKKGNDVHLTIDHPLQVKAEKLIAGKKGAIVVMNPATGEILAMVSKPDYNPESEALEQNWKQTVESKEYPLLARATQGMYVPGSTYKTVISAAAIEKGMEDRVFDDKGVIVIDGKEIRNMNSTAYGRISLGRALAVSSNTVFSRIGVELGEESLKNIAERFGFNKKIPFDIPVSQSVFPYDKMSKTDMAAVGMGQGKLLVTPLHMAMIASSIANDGVMMKPILVSSITSPLGNVIYTNKPEELYRTMSYETSRKLTEMMLEAVNNGTGVNARISGINVAGKTGTAENERTVKGDGSEHAWFIGFAPVEEPQVAVAVIIEYSGSSGGKEAAPIARELIKEWLSKNK